MRMWTRPPVKLRAGSSDRAPSYGPCGQALEKLALPHRLPTLGALAPTSSPLLQQRFMRTATAPTPTASQIAPSSQAIRLRNKPANSPGGSTRQSAKQQPTLGALAPTSSPLLQQRFMRTATAPTPTASQIAPSSQAIRLRNKPANSPGGSTRQSAKQQRYSDWKWEIASCEDGAVYTTAVGSYRWSNGHGLNDMSGNVWEWVEDCWHASYDGAPLDGSAWVLRGDCSKRGMRGGAWNDVPRLLRSALRHWIPSGHRYSSVGFRVARTLTP